MQIGLGDPQVPNIGSFLHARALGISLATPSPFAVPGLVPAAAADVPSSLTLFHFEVDATGYADGRPISPNVVHGSVRLTEAALRQMASFVKPGGTIIHACDGPCDPE